MTGPKLFRSIFVATFAAGVLPTALVAALLLGGAPTLATLALAVTLALAAAAALAWWLAGRITAPVKSCVRGALEIARGRFGREVPVHARNELGDLAHAFNHMSRELARQHGENQALIAALEEGWLSTIQSLAAAIDAKDPYTRGHSQRVSELSVEIGRELGLDGATLKALAWGGLLHDVGKIGVPEHILGKAGRLSAEEAPLMRAHPEIGAAIVEGVAFLKDAAPAVRSHHERWDGSGYPDQLAGEMIPLVARVVNAADTFDACASDRPYQRAMPLSEVLAILERLRGGQIDPRVHDALVAVVRRRAAPSAVAQRSALA